uniref:Uncharacterized protein n=1 Tax=Cacopsylla melanoneura TaxID=428564 RepID=A0A8D8ZB87_9HEMI
MTMIPVLLTSLLQYQEIRSRELLSRTARVTSLKTSATSTVAATTTVLRTIVSSSPTVFLFLPFLHPSIASPSNSSMSKTPPSTFPRTPRMHFCVLKPRI